MREKKENLRQAGGFGERVLRMRGAVARPIFGMGKGGGKGSSDYRLRQIGLAGRGGSAGARREGGGVLDGSGENLMKERGHRGGGSTSSSYIYPVGGTEPWSDKPFSPTIDARPRDNNACAGMLLPPAQIPIPLPHSSIPPSYPPSHPSLAPSPLPSAVRQFPRPSS